MEVHHPHHPFHKKKWSEYILEFFMLFLAVTLGFFAENIREKMAEEEKAKQLMEVVAMDLKSDILQMKMIRENEAEKIKLSDSIRYFLNANPKTIDQQAYYRILVNYGVFLILNTNDKSRSEAETQGYFLKEENKELAAYIKQYNFWLNDYNSLERLSMDQLKIFMNTVIPKITDPEIYDIQWRYPPNPIASKMGIVPIKPDAIRETKYLLSDTKMIMDGFISDIDSMTYYANKAIEIIEKKK